jgi:hypothetical protein
VSKWQQVWLLALERRRKLNDALDRLEEVGKGRVSLLQGGVAFTEADSRPWAASFTSEMNTKNMFL